MATINREGKRWRAQLFVGGTRRSKTFDTKAQASAWSLGEQAELKGDKLPDRTLGQAFEEYAVKVAPGHEGAKWDLLRLKAFGRHPIAKKRLVLLTGSDFASWRDDRLLKVQPSSVLREMRLLNCVLTSCRKDFGWLADNPMKDVTRPQEADSRKRRVTADEIERITLAFGLSEGLRATTTVHRTGLAFLLALETAMRSGEMLRLCPEDMELQKRFVRLPKTKNGDARDVPLTTQAVTILKLLPQLGDDVPVFDLKDGTRDVLWRKHRDMTEVVNLHFHDSRAEAIWRLSKKLDVLQLAKAIGHRDINSLLMYYNESASDMAMRLD